MRKIFNLLVILTFAACLAKLAFAQEMNQEMKMNSEGPNEASVNATVASQESAPSNENIQQAIKDYISEESQATGNFEVYDPETQAVRQLSFIKIHEGVGKTGDYYYSCTDFKDIKTGDMLDLDFDVENQEGEFNVADVRIHRLNEVERFTYDSNGNRVPAAHEEKKESTMTETKGSPLMEEKGSMMEKGSPMMEEKGSMMEKGNSTGQ